jgi:hypothetical protein
MRRLIRVRHSARHPAREQPDPHMPTPWTSQTSDQVAALLSRIDSLIGLRETS